MKQLITKAAIAVLAVFLSLPMMAVEVEIDGINYELVAKIKEASVIAKSSDLYSGDIIVPESVEYEGVTYSVTSIGDYAFYDCRNLTSITLQESMMSIGYRAFAGCSGLTSVIIPNSVTSVGEGAFGYCSGLTSLTVGNSVKAIGDDAFTWCFGLTSVHISDIAAWCNIEFGDQPLYYAGHLFLNGEEVKDLVIPNGVTSIGYEAFGGLSDLTSVSIPSSLTSIGYRAFEGCSGLTSVHISDIAAWCNIEFGDQPLCYAGHLFLNGEEVKDLVIPNSVKSIGDNAFCNCSGLTSVTIPNSVTSIGFDAFRHCSGLTSVAIPNSVTRIEHMAFQYCSGLTSVAIPNSVTYIGQEAFANSTGLTTLIIGSGVATIDYGAFADCPELLDVYCYAEQVPSFGEEAFAGSYPEYATLHVPDGSIEDYMTTTPWSQFGNIIGLSGEEPEVGAEKVLVDGEDYENRIDRDFEAIIYTRTLNNTEWNALYLPFEIPVNQLLEKYEVAYINAVHSYDDDENGEIDRMSMEIIKLKSGTLHANHPYLIKAKTEEAKEMNITVENTTLYKAESKTLDCSSIYTKFEITGTYERMTSEQLDGWYALFDGTWKHLLPNSYLDPFRLYLRISSREGSPVKVSSSAMARIGIHVQGEEASTSIEELLMQRDFKTEVVYDLNGRCITNPQKGQIYVVNGKKRMY